MFKGKKKEPKSSTRQKNSFIAPDIEINGDISGSNAALQIEGTVNGNISLNSVIIGEHGRVNGTINSKNVIVNGLLNGSVNCDTLEVMQNGTITQNVKVNEILVSGEVTGEIYSENKIHVDKNGYVKTKHMQSKNIIVDGIFKGNITASELLEIGSEGSVEGIITVKNITTHKGGKLLGSMQIYVEETETPLENRA